MALFDDITKKAAKFTEEAIDKTQEVAGNAKIKLKIKNLESDRDEVYCRLGKHYFQILEKEGSELVGLIEMRDQIIHFNEQIESLKKELDE